MRRPAILQSVSIAVVGAALWFSAGGVGAQTTAAQADPTAAPAVSTSPPDASSDDPAPLKLSYNNVPMGAVLNDLASHFDLVIIKSGPLVRRTSLSSSEAVDAAGAFKLLRDTLLLQGMTMKTDDAEGRVWQIAPATEKEQAAAITAAAEKNRAAAAGQAPTKTMKFQFVETPVETVLDEMSARLGIEINRDQPIPGRITIIVPQPVDAAEAVRLLNSVLIDSRRTAIAIDRVGPDGASRPAVRIGTIDDAKKGAIPVD